MVASGSSVVSASSRVRVQTRSGAVLGVAGGGVVAFKGVRYGASTAGSNRFRPPRPVAPWGGVLDASRYANRARSLRLPMPSHRYWHRSLTTC